MDQEIIKLLDDYVLSIQKKEGGLILFKKKIDQILNTAQAEFSNAQTELEKSFESNNIGEDEYLEKLKEYRTKIIQKTKSALDVLVSEAEQLGLQTDNLAKDREDKIANLRNQLLS